MQNGVARIVPAQCNVIDKSQARDPNSTAKNIQQFLQKSNKIVSQLFDLTFRGFYFKLISIRGRAY